MITVETHKTEHAHEKCGTRSTLACIEYQIYEHRYLLYQLKAYYNELLKESGEFSMCPIRFL